MCVRSPRDRIPWKKHHFERHRAHRREKQQLSEKHQTADVCEVTTTVYWIRTVLLQVHPEISLETGFSQQVVTERRQVRTHPDPQGCNL